MEESDGRIVIAPGDAKRYVAETNTPEKLAEEVPGCIREPSNTAKYFVLQGDVKEVILIAKAKTTVGGEVGYREPVGIAYNEETESIMVLRGRQLVDKLAETLPRSMPWTSYTG